MSDGSPGLVSSSSSGSWVSSLVSDSSGAQPSCSLEGPAINYTAFFSGLLSAIGGFLVFLSYILFKRLRSPPRALVTCLSFIDMLQGLFFCTVMIQPLTYDTPWCSLFAVFGIYVAVSSFFWTSCVGFYVFVHVYRLYSFQTNSNRAYDSINTRKTEVMVVFFHIISWGVPAVLCIVIMGFGVEGESGDAPWCFIPFTAYKWRMSYYLPLILNMVFAFIVWILTMFLLLRLHRTTRARYEPLSRLLASRALLIKLSLVPICFIILRLPGVIYRFDEFVSDDIGDFFCSYGYICLMTMTDASQGTVMFLLFVLFNDSCRTSYIDLITCTQCRKKGITHVQKKPDYQTFG
ncbi:G protein-coupled receptor 157 [Pelomyxa schiedti]|nr:G protein-coupled receptor 157 [Pelomyxa schiedti]